jgi:hypothetical protein
MAMRLNIASRTALHRIRFLLVSSLVMGLQTAHAAAALDFGYRIDGPVNVRPTLVFNDGEDTYIQPSGGVRTHVAGAQPDGPYLRLAGTPDSFTVRAGSITLRVQHAGLPSGPTSQAVYSAPVGAHADSTFGEQPVSAGRAPRIGTTAANDIVDKAASPAPGGSAAKPASLAASGGNQPPTVGGPIVSSPVTATTIPETTASAPVAMALVKKDPPAVSYLARDFGADGIREGRGGSIQIHFRARPTAETQFASVDGKRLDSSWDDSTSVMTVAAAPKFIVRNGHTSVTVSREVDETFRYSSDNAAGLEQVFAESGATYFSLADGTKKVTVRADGKVLPGRQKGRYYRVSGAGTSFVVDADGFDVTVTRSRTVRFVDHEGSAS